MSASFKYFSKHKYWFCFIGDRSYNIYLQLRHHPESESEDEDILTTEEGCRNRDAITTRTARLKAAGMMYMIRLCGMALEHIEMITRGRTWMWILLRYDVIII